MLERRGDIRRQPFGREMAPDPDVGVEEQLHFRASHSTSVPLGTAMSPAILAVPRIVPSHPGREGPGAGGTMSATGLPNRVTRKGRPVRRTRSSVARQVALNFEI